MATVITRYINGASSGGGDGTTTATAGTNRAYASFSAALSAMFTAYPDLVAADVQIDLIIDGTSADSSFNGNIQAFTTDATRFIRVTTTPNARHAGYWDSGKARFVTGVSVGGFYSAIPSFTKFESIVFECNSTGGYAYIFVTANGFSGLVFDSCLLHKSVTASQYSDYWAFNLSGANTKKILVRNCIATGNFAGFFKCNYADGSSEVGVYNNTVVGPNAGIDLGNTTNNRARAYNNIIELRSGAGGVAWVTVTQTTGNNITSDATGPQTGLRNLTATYVDKVNWDCRLDSSDTVAKDQGSDRSADSVYPFTWDILGNTRTGSWDIGAYELQGVTVLPQGMRFNAVWVG